MSKKRKNTKSWELLEEAMGDNLASKFKAIMLTCEDDEEFVKNYLKALEFFKPKIQRQEIVEEQIQDRTIKYEYIGSESDKVSEDENTSK